MYHLENILFLVFVALEHDLLELKYQFEQAPLSQVSPHAKILVGLIWWFKVLDYL